jgi:hypothetical protein
LYIESPGACSLDEIAEHNMACLRHYSREHWNSLIATAWPSEFHVHSDAAEGSALAMVKSSLGNNAFLPPNSSSWSL